MEDTSLKIEIYSFYRVNMKTYSRLLQIKIKQNIYYIQMALLPWSVKFHKHGFMLGRQVVEVCVSELDHIPAGRHGCWWARQQHQRHGRKHNRGRHCAEQRAPLTYR